MGKHLLLVDHALPTPDRDAGSAYTYSHLQILTAAGFDVTFLAPVSNPEDPYARALSGLGVAVPRVDDHDELREAVERLAPSCDVAVLYRAPVAFHVIDRIREVAPSAKVAFLPVDLHHLRMAREETVAGSDANGSSHMRSMEIGLVEAADATIVVSTFEHDLLLREVPGAQVHTVPILHETPRRTQADVARQALRRLAVGRWVAAHEPASRRRRDIVFLGGFVHVPNVDAVHWFVEEVLGLVRDAGVDNRFVIAGHAIPASVAALAREDVVVVGHVPDLADLFATARMSVVPLRIGAGFKGKIVTSLSFGVPVVTTSIGSEGGGLVDGYDALVADDPAGLAAHIVRLSSDDALWQNLSRASYETFRSRFSNEAGGLRLVSIVRELAQR